MKYISKPHAGVKKELYKVVKSVLIGISYPCKLNKMEYLDYCIMNVKRM